jgi:hypothetical protein
VVFGRKCTFLILIQASGKSEQGLFSNFLFCRDGLKRQFSADLNLAVVKTEEKVAKTQSAFFTFFRRFGHFSKKLTKTF